MTYISPPLDEAINCFGLLKKIQTLVENRVFRILINSLKAGYFWYLKKI